MFLKKKVIFTLFLIFFVSIIYWCNNEKKTINWEKYNIQANSKILQTKDENNKRKKDFYIDPNIINKINKLLSNSNVWDKTIKDCKNISIKNNIYWLDEFEKDLCSFNIELKDYFRNINQNNRYKKIVKNSKTPKLMKNEKLINIIKDFMAEITNNKNFYKYIYKNNFWLIKNNLYNYIIRQLNVNNRHLILFTGDIKPICNIITNNWKIYNEDQCIYSFSWYQNLDVCKFINKTELKEQCYNNEIKQCKNIIDNQWKIMCIYSTLLNVHNNNALLQSIKDPNFKSLVKEVIDNKTIVGNHNLKKKEQHDIDIFKNLTWNTKDIKKCDSLLYSNNKYQCNSFYNVLLKKDNSKFSQYNDKKIKPIQNIQDINITNLIKNMCVLNNIDEIKQSKEFKILENIVNKDKTKLKVISQNLYSKCIKRQGYIWTEEIFMNLIRQDNLSIYKKIENVLNSMNSKKYKLLLNNKKINTLDYKQSIISMMLYKYKYWKYHWKTFYLNRLLDNLLYKKLIKDINKKLSTKQLIKLINKQYNLKLNSLNNAIILKVILNDIKTNSNNLLSVAPQDILQSKVLKKNLGIKETWKCFNKDILDNSLTKKIITDEYLLMYLFPNKIFNDTVRRQNYLNKEWINWFFVENLFRFYRLKWNKSTK